MENVQKLDIPDALGTVEVDGVLGVFYKIRLDGEAAPRVKGKWTIPMRNGGTASLSARGVLPGFQTLYVDGAPVYAIGAHVDTALRIVMFLPLLLIGVNPLFGVILGGAMFFMNISLVKNPLMPYPLRIALPIINTLVGGFALILLLSLLP